MAEKHKKTSRLASFVGISIALILPLVYSLVIGPIYAKPVTAPDGYALLGFVVYWLLSALLFIIVKFWEDQPFESLGLKPLSWKMVLVAIGLGVVLSLAVPVLTLLANQIIPTAETGGVIDTAAQYSAGIVLLSVLTAGITEEVIYRGYAIERLSQLTGKPWLSGVISFIAFVLVHASSWNLTHIIGVVIPLGLILTALYLWKRNLVFLIIVHIVIDLPLFFFALGT